MTRVEIKVTLPSGWQFTIIQQKPAEHLPSRVLATACEDAKKLLAAELAR